LKPGDRVLDAGCGRYLTLCRDLSGTARLVGIDLENTLETDNRSAPYGIRGDLNHLPFPGGCFDMVISRSVIEHLEDPPGVFREFARVLRPGGKVVLVTPNKYDYVSLIAAITPFRVHQLLVSRIFPVSEHDVFPTLYRANTLSALRKALRSAGLVERDLRGVNHYPAYLMFSPTLFRLGILYERITSLPALEFLRGLIVSVFEKPGRPTNCDNAGTTTNTERTRWLLEIEGKLTDRQRREIAYHTQRAVLVRRLPVKYDVLTRTKQKWWNHYGRMYQLIVKAKPSGKRVLVPGCGSGFDAIILAHLGAKVSAFDLSADMLSVAEEGAAARNVSLDLQRMPAEELLYEDNTFDLIWGRDILHHCDIGRTMGELIRVAKPHAQVFFDEVYTHSFLQRIREGPIGRLLYRVVEPVIYPHGTYTTEDERKLNESELRLVAAHLKNVRIDYFNAVINRFIPEWKFAAMVDRSLLRALPRVGQRIAGRFIIRGTVEK
ncbi:MAG: methyltransferase domain-containing protein, partial [Bryobacteraceae bacterium]